MKIVRLQNNVVFEIIPIEATPVATWYGEDFAKQCIEAPDNIEQGWIYDGENFYLPSPEPEIIEPSQLDRIEAQITYTAMMTDTLMEV